ncbi:MAG: biotin-dependent carboxyltransferase [Silicimonas sp.]|nr:biotin-dependent carboxyltransferase [Silicimonas sp.]
MSRELIIESVGPAVSVQDLGRPGCLGQGLSRGGAADRLGFIDGAVLLGQSPDTAALEMAGMGGRFAFTQATRFALSGAKMRATLDRAPIEWNASHLALPGMRLEIGAAENGVYGYLHVGGGLDTEVELGGRGYHKIAGLGRLLAAGNILPIGQDKQADAAPMRLAERLPGKGPIRVMPGPQSDLFGDGAQAAFEAATFVRSPRANRQGVRLDHDGAPFATKGQLTLVSDFITEGDIQMTGDGTPYVLLAECQTMGGYPRIGTVIPTDLSRIAQALPGDALVFRIISTAEAEALWQSETAYFKARKAALAPRVRDPREMTDLLSYELIDRPDPDVAG